MNPEEARLERAKLLEDEDELRSRSPEWFYENRRAVKDLVIAVIERRMGDDMSVVHSGMGSGKKKAAKLHFNILFRSKCDERTGCRSLTVGSKEAVIEICPRTEDKKQIEMRLVYQGAPLPGGAMRVNKLAMLFRLEICESMEVITGQFEQSYYDGIVHIVDTVVKASQYLRSPTPKISTP